MGSGIIAMFLIGLSNLISIILFGMKAFVINDIGIIYCEWKVKTIYWKDIKNIEVYSIPDSDCYNRPDYELIIYFKNGKKKTISLVNISIKFSEKNL